MPWRSIDFWTGGVIAALGALVLLVLIPYGIEKPVGLPSAAIPPAFWPKVTGWILMLVGIAIAVEGISKSAGLPSFNAREIGRNAGRAASAFAALYVSWALIPWIGLPASSGLLIIVLGLLFGETRIVTLLVIAALMPLALYYFFTLVCGVPVPTGSFFD